jgi:hypothetical protein
MALPSHRSHAFASEQSSSPLPSYSSSRYQHGGGVHGAEVASRHPHGHTIPLHSSMDVVLQEASRTREESQSAEQESFDVLKRTSWPNQPAGVAARALVVRVSRACARLRAATERLEVESAHARERYAAEMRATTQRAAQICASLVAQRDMSETVLQNELLACEEEHRSLVSALGAANFDVVHRGAAPAPAPAPGPAPASSPRKPPPGIRPPPGIKRRATPGSLATRVMELAVQRSQAVEQAGKLEHWVATLEKEKAQLADARDADAARHAVEMDKVHAILASLQEELRQSHEKRCIERQELDAVKQRAVEAERALRLQLVETKDAMRADADRLQREIDHMHALQTAALAAGSYKGRQMHYVDSLRAKPPRANETRSESLVTGSRTTTWRDGVECEAFAKQMMAKIGTDVNEPPVQPPWGPNSWLAEFDGLGAEDITAFECE